MAEKEKDTVMSKIQPYLDIIKNEPSGESVRDAIINCMKIINADSMIETLHKEITVTDATLPFSRSYTAGDGKAWHQITINLSSDSEASSTMTFAEFEVNDDTVNGTYTPENMGLAANTYWNKINVNVLRRYEGVGDVAIIEDCLYDEELGMSYWEAEPHGYNPVSKVYFSNEYQLPKTPVDPINPTNKTYTVNFYSESGTLIQQINDIKYGDDASYYFSGTIPEKPGYHFLTWKPDVTYVTHNVKTYATYVKAEPSPSSAPYNDWEELCADRGAKAAIGSIMSYDITSTKTVPETDLKSEILDNNGNPIVWTIPQSYISTLGSLAFMKVDDEGAGNGSTSTWLSTTPLRMNIGGDNFDNKVLATLANQLSADSPNDPMRGDYRQSILNKFLNEFVFKLLDPCLQSTIKNVQKVQYGIANVNETGSDLYSINPTSIQVSSMFKLWLPSMMEIAHVLGITEPGGELPDTATVSKYVDRDGVLKHAEMGGRLYESWYPNLDGDLSNIIINTRTCKTDQLGIGDLNNVGKNLCRFSIPVIEDPETHEKSLDTANILMAAPEATSYMVDGNVKALASYVTTHLVTESPWTSGLYIGFCL